jgi:hypothetical protein
MNGFKKTVMIVDNLEVDDHLKISGVLYRVNMIQKIGDSYTISFYNVRRPVLEGLLTVGQNTLMHVWNQK